jgi:hypothetical protein
MSNYFKIVPNFRGYEINKDGVVRRVKTRKICILRSRKSGVVFINITSPTGRRTCRTIKGLIEEAFKNE